MSKSNRLLLFSFFFSGLLLLSGVTISDKPFHYLMLADFCLSASIGTVLIIRNIVKVIAK